MRTPRPARPVLAPINMTPMIDVVFQLIVFFTATSTMARNEVSQAVELPVAQKGHDREPSAQHTRVTANVLANGEVYVAGKLTGAAQFRDLLAAELTRQQADHLEVQFRADREVPYGAIEPLLLACARAGVWRVSFAVKPAERP